MGACLPGAAAAILASRCATDTSAVGPSNVCVVGRAVLGRGVGEGGDFKHTAARPGIAVVAFRLREAKNALGTPVCRTVLLLAMLRVNMADKN